MEKIHLKNVRLSFPSVFEKAQFDGKATKYEATFLLDKDEEKTKAMLDKAIASAMKDAKVSKVGSDKRFIKDGDDCEYDGYEGCWSIKASSKKRPTVMDRDKSILTEDDEVLYPGCYVNAIISVWVQNNAYGKRVNASLHGVQFCEDGEEFGMGAVDVSEDFEDLDEL